MEKHGHKCVGWCEKDKFAQKSYKAIHNTEGEWFNADITTVQPGEIPEADVYCGGFPCQSFSIAGERGGFDDIRGTLIFEILRLAKERQPKYLFLENVKGLLNHDKGATFSTILKSMAEVGYDAEWQVLNSKDFGVPQNRERVFIIGHLRGASTRKVFPIRRITKNFCDQIGNIEGITGNESIKRVYSGKGCSPTITDCQGGYREPFIKEETDLQYVGSISDNSWLEQDKDKSRGHHEGNRVYSSNGIAPTHSGNKGGKSGNSQLIEHEMRIRKLTPRECWRLQGFPDWAFEKAAEVNSDTQLYRQTGNSVTIPVVYEIAKRLKGR